MSWATTARFYEQLRLLLKSGLPLRQALDSLSDRAEAPYRSWLPTMIRAADAGEPLSTQLRAHGEKALPTALIEAGEASGQLPELCAEIVDYYEHATRVRNKIIAGCIYPLLILHVALIAPGIVGWVRGTTSGFGILLPILILWTIIVGIGVAFRLGSLAWLGGKLATWPVCRDLVRPLVAANTCLIIHAGAVSGMFFPDMLALAASCCGNRLWGDRLLATSRRLRREELHSLTAALKDCDMPRAVIDLCAAGEESGELEQTMARAAVLQRETFQSRLLWTARLATAIVTAIAFAVAIITIFSIFESIYAPLHNLL